MLGVAYQGVELFDANNNVQLHPCVALDESGDDGHANRFRMNLGSEPFKFDLMAYRTSAKLPAPDPAKQQPVSGGEELAGELMDEEEETFEMATDLVRCCLEVVMDAAQKEAAYGHEDIDYEQAALEAATIMLESEYDTWPEWLRQHFQLTEEGEVEPQFEVSVFQQWLEEQEAAFD
jgi:hypothetical protein